MKHVFAVDLGGTTVKFAVVNEDGVIMERWAIPTDTGQNGSHILDDIVCSLSDKLTQYESISAIGAGIPGPVRGETVVRAVNLGWEQVPFADQLNKAMNMPVVLLNDANAAALGEVWKGGGIASKGGNAVFVTLGTGVGGGIIIDGNVVNGEHGCAGEIGHYPMQIEGEARLCGCGNVNCLETFASATGLVKTMNALCEQAGEKRRVSNGEEVFALVKEGDLVACKARDAMVDALAHGLASVICTVDPQEVIVGGGLSRAGSYLLDPLAERLNRYVFPTLRGAYALRCASLGNDAGLLGAALQAFRLLGDVCA